MKYQESHGLVKKLEQFLYNFRPLIIDKEEQAWPEWEGGRQQMQEMVFFFIQPLAQILHLHPGNLHCVVV